jgi:hypothetical protein
VFDQCLTTVAATSAIPSLKYWSNTDQIGAGTAMATSAMDAQQRGRPLCHRCLVANAVVKYWSNIQDRGGDLTSI